MCSPVVDYDSCFGFLLLKRLRNCFVSHSRLIDANNLLAIREVLFKLPVISAGQVSIMAGFGL